MRSFKTTLAGVLLLMAVHSAEARPPRNAEERRCSLIFEMDGKKSPPEYIPYESEIQPQPPSPFHDPVSKITLRAEGDGRHISAFDQKGKVLWRRNPFVDAKLCPYRLANPTIEFIGTLSDMIGKPFDATAEATLNENFDKMNKRVSRFVYVRFNSSQDGSLDMKTGDFFFFGQN